MAKRRKRSKTSRQVQVTEATGIALVSPTPLPTLEEVPVGLPHIEETAPLQNRRPVVRANSRLKSVVRRHPGRVLEKLGRSTGLVATSGTTALDQPVEPNPRALGFPVETEQPQPPVRPWNYKLALAFLSALLVSNLILLTVVLTLNQELSDARQQTGWNSDKNNAQATAWAKQKSSLIKQLEQQKARLENGEKHSQEQQARIDELDRQLNEAKKQLASANWQATVSAIEKDLDRIDATRLAGSNTTPGATPDNQKLASILNSGESGATSGSVPLISSAISGPAAQKLSALSFAPHGWPVNGPITSPFGPRPNIFSGSAETPKSNPTPKQPTGQGGELPPGENSAATTTPTATPCATRTAPAAITTNPGPGPTPCPSPTSVISTTSAPGTTAIAGATTSAGQPVSNSTPTPTSKVPAVPPAPVVTTAPA